MSQLHLGSIAPSILYSATKANAGVVQTGAEVYAVGEEQVRIVTDMGVLTIPLAAARRLEQFLGDFTDGVGRYEPGDKLIVAGAERVISTFVRAERGSVTGGMTVIADVPGQGHVRRPIGSVRLAEAENA